jgi:hypothetical protein
MGFRIFCLAASALLLCGADDPPPPEQLKPYIKDGRFDPGDFGWMRGRFADASKAQKDAYVELSQWTAQCFADAKSRLKSELAARGFPNTAIDTVPVGPLLCRQVAYQPMLTNWNSFAEFQAAQSRVRPISETFFATANLATQIAGPRGPGLADALTARPTHEQILRSATSWGTGSFSQVPQLGADEKAILLSRIGIATASEDHANTEWLKRLVRDEGWPKISVVGEQAAAAAWLLVQHADADPLFQLEALRLMEPLLESGEVSKQNFAYLYDRIMLKLVGKQRYATQAGPCENGKRRPQPLEDETAVERLRKEAGLNPLNEYIAQLEQFAGPCP